MGNVVSDSSPRLQHTWTWSRSRYGWTDFEKLWFWKSSKSGGVFWVSNILEEVIHLPTLVAHELLSNWARGCCQLIVDESNDGFWDAIPGNCWSESSIVHLQVERTYTYLEVFMISTCRSSLLTMHLNPWWVQSYWLYHLFILLKTESVIHLSQSTQGSLPDCFAYWSRG